MSEYASLKNFVLCNRVNFVTSPLAEVSKCLCVHDNLRNNEVMLFDFAESSSKRITGKSTSSNRDRVYGGRRSVNQTEYSLIFLRHDVALCTLLCAVDNIETTFLDLIEANLWIRYNLERRNEDAFALNELVWSLSTLRNDEGLRVNIAVINGECALWQWVYNKKFTSNTLIIQ